ncbi:hypothetical protein WMF38_06005 [Sorangium sp. So ce118]
MSGPLRVFLAGEGRNELGSRAGHPSYQSNVEVGILEALLARIRRDGWTVVGALQWKHLCKLRARGPSPTEAEQIERLILRAEEAEADIVAFSRDGDDEGVARQEAILVGVQRARAGLSKPLAVVGEVALPSLEGWILALLGQRGTEDMTPARARREIENAGLVLKSTASMVRVVERCPDLGEVPDDAKGLIRWRDAAQAALAPSPGSPGES